MEIITENVKSFKNVISKSENCKYDWDIIVPDSKPDVGRIISADAVTQILTKEIMQDRAMISGNAKINILYVPADNPSVVKNVETIQNFNYVMELSGLRQNMTLNILSSAEKTDISILNSRKLHITSNLSFLGNVTSTNEISCISEIKNNDVLYKTKEISTYKAISEIEKAIEISEELEVPMGKPSINEILKIDLKINNKDVRPIHNKLVVKGELELVTIYNSEMEGDSVEYMCHEIPFAEILDISGINENTVCDTDFNLKNITCSLKEDREGEKRIIVIEATLFIQSRNYEKVKINSVVDAYSLTNELDIEKNGYMFDEIINQINGQFNIKETAVFNNINNILKVISVGAKTDIKNVCAKNNTVTIKGDILCDVLYISTDNSEINSSFCSVPFEHTIECEGAKEDVICDLKLDIIKCAYNILSPNELELRVNVEYTAIIKRDMLSELICDISYDESKTPLIDKCGLIVYFCSGNEEMWDIAKKYKTTVDEILIANNLSESEEIRSGMKLLIP